MGANMMLTIGALTIFGIFLATSNKMMVGNNQIASQNEYYIAGISIAQSLIDEAKSKAFDEKTRYTRVTSPLSLTPSNKLGPDGEIVPVPDTLGTSAPYSALNPGYWSSLRYNDVDDYNGYRRYVNTPRAEGYKLFATVSYASATYPDSTLSTQTYCKSLTVKVTSPYFRTIGYDVSGRAIWDTLSLNYAFTY